AFNTLLAFLTARWGSLAEWTLYNGFLSYLLIGGFWGGEMLFRRRIRRRWAAAESSGAMLAR
ncbi:MAG TPA: hypothetical protein VFX38_03200, partial [Gammaproteobacteria bacterium]|nr:hypothetical protein [Gammaproteobacteria bacterium]